jgi:hypothetical protein
MQIVPIFNPRIELQPKQGTILDLVEEGTATWVGGGGGRGGAKSGCIHRVMLARRLMHPGTIGAIVMRNSDQVRDYHELPIIRTWPQLEAGYHKGERTISLPFRDGPPSVIKFTYAETLKDVIRRFRSANYFDIAIDQAEQFTEEELREIKQAVRWPGVPEGTCKLWLFFNMGGVGIDFMRKKFHDLEYNEREDPKQFEFVHFFPYDNVEWSRPALEADGLTPEDYYSWSEKKRIEYCATRSQYGRDLMSQDDALVKRDFYGSWDVLEGAFFAKSFDRNSTVISPETVDEMVKPWWERWLAQDWARGHFCPTYWMAHGEMSPAEAKRYLDWDVRLTLRVIVVYREYIAGGETNRQADAAKYVSGEFDEQDVAAQIVERTPQREREQMSDFFLSPDAFGKKSSQNTIAQIQGEILSEAGMPYPRQADHDRPGGWSLISRLFLATKRKGQRNDQVILISANCPALISSIPLLMRNPKDLSDVLKTDESTARIEMDCFVAGTPVWTLRGQVPIEAVRAGDHAMTRLGWKRVTRAWKNRIDAPVVRALFSDGREIFCTPDHRFWTQRGFCPLNTLRYDDKLLSWNSLNSMGEPIDSVRMGITLAAGDSCTGRSGLGPSAPFLAGCISTIKTMLQRALRTLTTWNASLQNSTCESMGRFASPIQPHWQKRARQQRIGTSPEKVEHGTGHTQKGGDRQSPSRSANNAGMDSTASLTPGFAVPSARLNGGEIINSISSRFNASSAAMLCCETDFPTSEPVASNAVLLYGLETAGFADVYDLEVEDAHEFFANGILVHNCSDAFRYALKSKLEPGKKPKAVENEEKLRALQEAGLDQHSLNVYRIQLSQEVRTSEAPARLGHGRVGRRM